MAVEDDNVQALRAAYEQWAGSKGQDFSCWTNLACDALSMRSLGQGAPEMRFSKPRSGKSELVEYLTQLTDDWEMVRAEAEEFIAQGDRVVVVSQIAWRNKATGKVAEGPKVDLWRFRDGQAVEYAEFYDTAGAIAAASPD